MIRFVFLACVFCAAALAFAAPASAQARCLQGFVWREAFAGDYVCVPPATRSQAAQDNSLAAARVQPGGGAYGAATCRSGFVWREARQGDLVCVPPETRAQAAEDNRLASSRTVSIGANIGAAMGVAGGFSVSQNIDRPGGDYTSFDMAAGGWQACRDACQQDNQCRAFTYVRPGVQSASARCWLKNTVPAGVQNGCCISGSR
ncbi:MAG: PAN domain-containing protein [Hyphomonadaceae bacterium]|nr:PAN domain-containing protein [Hyphomonadaceae bacterium]